MDQDRTQPVEGKAGASTDTKWTRVGDKPEWRNGHWSVALTDKPVLHWVVCNPFGNAVDRREGFTVDQVDAILEWAEKVRQTGRRVPRPDDPVVLPRVPRSRL